MRRNEWIFVYVVFVLTIAAVIYPAFTFMSDKSNVIGISVELRDKILQNNRDGLAKDNQLILGQILKDNNIILKADEMCKLDLANWQITIKGGLENE